MAIMCLTTMYALLKLQFMFLRKSPTIISFVDEQGVDPSEGYDIADNDFMLAFSASHFTEGAKTDSRYT